MGVVHHLLIYLHAQFHLTQLHNFTLSGFYLGQVGDTLAEYLAAILFERNDGIHIIEGAEGVLIIEFHIASTHVKVTQPDVLIIVLHLIGMGVVTAVGGNDSVTVEVVVAGRITSCIATILPNLLTGNLAGVAQTLVYEVPNETTLILGILAGEIPIFGKSAH